MVRVIENVLNSLNGQGVPSQAAPQGLEPLYTVSEVQRWWHVSESFVRKAISRKQLKIMKIGARTLIPKSALDEYLSSKAEK